MGNEKDNSETYETRNDMVRLRVTIEDMKLELHKAIFLRSFEIGECVSRHLDFFMNGGFNEWARLTVEKAVQRHVGDAIERAVIEATGEDSSFATRLRDTVNIHLEEIIAGVPPERRSVKFADDAPDGKKEVGHGG